jgi:hypothetical protein
MENFCTSNVFWGTEKLVVFYYFHFTDAVPNSEPTSETLRSALAFILFELTTQLAQVCLCFSFICIDVLHFFAIAGVVVSRPGDLALTPCAKALSVVPKVCVSVLLFFISFLVHQEKDE